MITRNGDAQITDAVVNPTSGQHGIMNCNEILIGNSMSIFI